MYNKPPRGGYMSFEEAYKEFKIYAQKRHKKQSFDCFVYNFNANILTYFKDYSLNDINNDLINDWQDFIFSKGFCNNHNKNLLSMLISFLEYCVLYYNFDNIIIKNIIPFKLNVESSSFDFYTLKEFKKFIKHVDNIVYKTFFEFMFFAGTRPGEAMALKFSDLKGNYININKTIDEHGKRTLGTPKTVSSNRCIPINNNLVNKLLKLKKYYINQYCENIDYFIFGGINPLAPTTINRHKLIACKLANIRPITLHQFRHSHATLLFNYGIDAHVISKRLGHSKVSTTLDIYIHSNLIQEKRVIKLLNFLQFNFFDCFVYNFIKKLNIY